MKHLCTECENEATHVRMVPSMEDTKPEDPIEVEHFCQMHADLEAAQAAFAAGDTDVLVDLILERSAKAKAQRIRRKDE